MKSGLHVTTHAGGILAVRKTESGKPFALVYPPRKTRSRSWGIKFRDYTEGFSPGFNRSALTRADAMRQLEDSVRVCSDYQLGLEATP